MIVFQKFSSFYTVKLVEFSYCLVRLFNIFIFEYLKSIQVISKLFGWMFILLKKSFLESFTLNKFLNFVVIFKAFKDWFQTN